jgi:uncharacterized coiled-coil protein SlyX
MMSARDIERISQLERQIAHLMEKVQSLSGRVVELENKKQQTLGLPKK